MHESEVEQDKRVLDDLFGEEGDVLTQVGPCVLGSLKIAMVKMLLNNDAMLSEEFFPKQLAVRKSFEATAPDQHMFMLLAKNLPSPLFLAARWTESIDEFMKIYNESSETFLLVVIGPSKMVKAVIEKELVVHVKFFDIDADYYNRELGLFYNSNLNISKA